MQYVLHDLVDRSAAGRVGAYARWANEFHNEKYGIDPLELLDEQEFWKHLVTLHGEAYLQRPDGEPLAIVDPSGAVRGYAIPRAHTYTPHAWEPRVTYRHLPAGHYTGNGMDDIQTQMRDKAHDLPYGQGLELIKQALAQGEMTTYQIGKATGLTYVYLRSAMNKYSGKFWQLTDRKTGKAHYWKLINAQ
jgi:hypothetical protein